MRGAPCATRRELVGEGYDLTACDEDDAKSEWDSNVITPGTEFMYKLGEYLRFYIADRINHNPAWRNIKARPRERGPSREMISRPARLFTQVIFSDANEPGEGEHKIMSFLRQQRTQPGYDPNQRHVLHGLDADLIMLGLALHEPHFFVLREEVLFGRREREKREADELRKATEAVTGVTDGVLAPADRWVYNKNLQILQISTLREYLRAEFRVCEAVPFRYDFERVVDDFVFMCFFVGMSVSRSVLSLQYRKARDRARCILRRQ